MRAAITALLAFSLSGSSAHAFAENKVVVIDPGHGGGRPGTKNTAGVYESAIVLGIAKVAREILERDGIHVLMTRDEDKDVDLDDRVAIANSAKASVFVSVHANWAPVPERAGAETYILSPNASDEASAELVHLENEGGPGQSEDAFGGASGGGSAAGGDGALDLILQDLSRMSAHKDSALLAKTIQDHLGRVRGLLPSRGLRQAPFKVLRGAKMPAVLVEIGYLSHPSQGALLATQSGQKQAGEAIAKAVLRFFKEVAD